MIFMTGKEAGIIAIIAVIGVHYFIRNILYASLLLLFCIFIFINIESIFTLFEKSNISKIEKIGKLGILLIERNFNDQLLNLVTTNRWSEYKSLFEVWQNQGTPILGYGLGHVIDVFLYHKNDYIERSTFHNSLIVLYHKMGIFGVFLILYYFFSMLLQRKRSNIYTYIAFGFLSYCLFNYSLLQAPSIILIVGMFHRAKEVVREV
jgi:hypothetical protein